MAKAKKKGKAVSKVEAGSAVSAYEEDAGAGFEDIGQDEMIVPFLNLLQKMSPLVDDESATYIQGAKAGMIMNSATEELFHGQEGVRFIPVHRVHQYVEWVPRTSGGGFVGIHSPSDAMIIEAKKGGAFGKLESPEGNDLVETFYVFGLVLDSEGGYMPASIAFTSTQIRAYKKWMTTMRTIQLRDPETGQTVTPPMFAHVFRLRSRGQENAKGSWHGWSIGYANEKTDGMTPAEASRLSTEDELYQAARSCRSMVMESRATVSHANVRSEADNDPDAF